MAAPPPPPPPPPPPAGSGSAGAKASAPHSARPRILIVEDDEDLLRMMHRMLSTIADVAMAADGEQALKILERGPLPQIVITDWMMPRKDGPTLVREMKAHEQWKNIPVVMLTAKTAPRDVIAGINSGARHYLTKPFKPDELISKVKKVLKIA